jgi:hypothetical protein
VPASLTLLPYLSDEGLLAFPEVQKAPASPWLRALSPEEYSTTEALARERK